MALNDDVGITMPVAPTGYGMPYYGGNNGLFGGSDSWLGILFLIALCNGGFGFGGGFGGWGMMNGMWGMDGLYPWLNNSQNINDGFRSQQISSQIGDIQNSITAGFGNVQTSLCSGFAGVNATVNGAQNALAQQMYTNQISDLERSFAAQTASTQGMSAIQAQLAQCCCDNRAATQDVKYTIATEACANRATSTANTQAILDKLCQLELDGFKRENDQLRSQLQFANLQASQVAQTAELRASQATTANQLVSELRSCPIPAQPVYGNQPIFSCGQNVAGCGCSL